MSGAESFTAVRYRCPFCRRSWSSKARANTHVAQCWMDPAQRSCKTCKHHDPGAGHTYEEPGWPESCDLSDSAFPEGHVFLNRDGEARAPADTWWPQRNCPLWELAAWIKARAS